MVVGLRPGPRRRRDRTGLPVDEPGLWCWRHPPVKRPREPERGVRPEPICYGRTDLPVDRRQAKRVAHRIRAQVRRERLPKAVWVSPSQRCRRVGEYLKAMGFVLHVDTRLQEADFGAWEGLAWSAIGQAAVEAWAQDLLHHRPGGGESLWELAERARAFAAEACGSDAPRRVVVTHGGWILALQHVKACAQQVLPQPWPSPPRPGQWVRWQPGPAQAGSPLKA